LTSTDRPLARASPIDASDKPIDDIDCWLVIIDAAAWISWCNSMTFILRDFRTISLKPYIDK
jgi:hypothetical protein